MMTAALILLSVVAVLAAITAAGSLATLAAIGRFLSVADDHDRAGRE